MTEPSASKLNWLQKHLPEGLLVDAAWLTRNGYSSSLRTQYVAAGWLEQPARRVFARPRGALRWEQVVISLQTLLELPLTVGGRTALELQGFAHYPAREQAEVHLYGHRPPPSWLHQLPLPVRFVVHNSSRLFRNEPIRRGLASPSRTPGAGHGPAPGGLVVQPWGQWDWPLTLSTPERAALELLDELPDRESFHQADKLIEGLTSLSPHRLQQLLEDCRSVKVKRLFFFFADGHGHAWLRRLDRSRINLGTGKRMLVRGGRLDAAHAITVPRDLDAVS